MLTRLPVVLKAHKAQQALLDLPDLRVLKV
jgi:hypothetical protein